MEENRKKTLILTIIAVVTLILVTVGATFAYFMAQGGEDVTKNVDVTTNTTDSLTFVVENPISFSANQDNFGQGMGNQSGSTGARATLIANNGTNTATEYYNLTLNITNNSFVYTTAEQQAELILTVTAPDGQTLQNISGLNYVTVGDISGFDITTKTGEIAISSNYEITSTNTTVGEIQEWEVKLTFVNLNSDQNANTGKTFDAEVKLSK